MSVKLFRACVPLLEISRKGTPAMVCVLPMVTRSDGTTKTALHDSAKTGNAVSKSVSAPALTELPLMP